MRWLPGTSIFTCVDANDPPEPDARSVRHVTDERTATATRARLHFLVVSAAPRL
jgi:hypothetical protein